MTVQRRTSPTGSESGNDGWLLRLQAKKATTRLYRPGEGYGPPIVLRLDPAETARLAGRLLELELAGLPMNLYGEHYTDLRVSVLNREKRVQARKFGRLSPTTLGVQQRQFDRLLEELETLQRRVLREGTAEARPKELRRSRSVAVRAGRALPP